MNFIDEDFLLHSNAACRLYHEFAEGQPILDYHNHLPPADIAKNRRFDNLAEIWLGDDHYKWRAMRADGVPERCITGDADPYEKFLAWARTTPNTLRNPLYHWTHLELRRHFGIQDLLSESTARSVWDRTREQLASPDFGTWGILKKFKVAALCTTDDPVDRLDPHTQIASSELATRVYPTFRPDRAVSVGELEEFNRWTDLLGHAAEVDIVRLADFEEALRRRHDAFHKVGCRLSDHGLYRCPAEFPTVLEAAGIFERARGGFAIDTDAAERFAGHMMLFFGRLDAERGWTKQLHLGPLRGTSSRAAHEIGPNAGFDSIGDAPQAESLAAYLDTLDREGALPKTIIYNVNPAQNYVFSTMIGNFQRDVPGKIQFGSGWWYLDAKQGIEWQLDALSNNGLLSRFVGMLTDSRSFMSFPRHEYFRRILCNVLGAEMERRELPHDFELVGRMVENICFENARSYLGLEVAA